MTHKLMHKSETRVEQWGKLSVHVSLPRLLSFRDGEVQTKSDYVLSTIMDGIMVRGAGATYLEAKAAFCEHMDRRIQESKAIVQALNKEIRTQKKLARILQDAL